MQRKTTTARGVQGPDRPTLLMVGSGDPMDAALKVALDRHGLFVETVGTENLRGSVHLTAPDLVLLVGDAAKDGGRAALSELAADGSTAAIPVVLLAPDDKLESRMHAFRHGAMAVVPRSASADGIAREVRRHSKEMSEHFEEKTGEIGEATFDELVEIVTKELRSGILSVHAPGHKGGPLRVVLGAGRPVTAAVQEFVARLSPHVKQAAADPMYYQFHTSAGGPVELLGEADRPPGSDVQLLEGVRVVLVDDDPTRADALAQELRARGSIVFVTDTEGRHLERAAGLDPHVAIVDASGLEGRGFEVVRAIRKDLRLRWASILVAPWGEIWPDGAPTPDMEQLASRIEPLLSPEQDLARRTEEEDAFDTRLESTGPGRMLRVLVETGGTLHLTVKNPKAVIEIDLAEGLVVGAKARIPPGEEVEGAVALAVLLALGSGRVHVEHRPNPSVANVMSPVEEALSAASAEPSRVQPSMPPRGSSPAADVHVPIEDDTEDAEAASTRIRDLSGLAHAGEALLDDSMPTMRPPELPVDPKESRRTPPPPDAPVGGPVAANERGRKPARRKATLVMGAPAIPEDPGQPSHDAASAATAQAPAAVPAPLPGAPQKRPPRLKRTMVGMQSVEVDTVAPPSPGAGGSPAAAGPEAASTETVRAPYAESASVGAPETQPSETQPSKAQPSEAQSSEAQSSEAAPPEAARPEAPPSDPQAALPPRLSPADAAATREPTEPIVTNQRPRKSGARWVAKLSVALAGLVLLSALGLIGYRYSGASLPALDRALVALGVGLGDGAGVDETAPPGVADEDGQPTPEPPAPNEAPPITDGTASDAVGETADGTATEPDETPADETPTDETADSVVVDETLDAEADETTDEAATPDEAAASADDPDAEEDDVSTAEELVDRARRAGNSDLAERLYRRALAVDAQEHHAMVGLARLLMDRGENGEAAELLRGAIRRRPRRAPYRIWLGDALAAAGDGAGAQRAWREALEVDPDSRQARQRLGQ